MRKGERKREREGDAVGGGDANNRTREGECLPG